MTLYMETANIYNLIIYLLTFIFLSIASISDLKKREIPDWLNYGAIAVGFGLNLLFTAISLNLLFIINSVLGFAVFFILAYVLFYSGQWGGGDSKALMALGALIGINFRNGLPLLATFIFNVAIAGAIYGLVWSFALAFAKRKKFFAEFKKRYCSKNLLISKIAIIVLLISTLLSLFTDINPVFKILFIGFTTAIVLTFYVWLFVVSVEKSCMHKIVEPGNLTEGDWITNDITMNKRILIRSHNKPLKIPEIKRLRKTMDKIDPNIKVKRRALFIINKKLDIKLSKIKKHDILLENIKKENLNLKKGTKINSDIYDTVAVYFSSNNLPCVNILRKILFVNIKKTVHPSNIKKGDVLLQDITMQKYICGPRDHGISKAQIKLLQKLGIKKIAIKEGIPFVPSFLIAFLLTIFI